MPGQIPQQKTITFSARLAAWQARGLSCRAASVLADVGCQDINHLARLGRSTFEGRQNCGAKTLDELARLAGWPAKQVTAAGVIATALTMAMGPDEAKEAAIDALIALRQSGFVISARRAE